MRYLKVAGAALLAALAAGAPALGQDEYPFPQLHTKKFCEEFVSKVLDKGEQSLELLKGLDEEAYLRTRLDPWWPFIDRRLRKQILATNYKEDKFHPYTTILSYAASAIGRACLDGRIKCENPIRPQQIDPAAGSPL